ncbi:MAG: DUF2318 domain-containing protein [Ruminococcus sp.]|nr:DUF2318 domain-containing protein [Ruminococcus sp.]
MLKYLVQLTNDLLTPAIIIGILSAYILAHFGKRGKIILLSGLSLSVVGSCVMAVLKNTTKLIKIDYWNLYTVAVFLGAFLLFFLLSFDKLRGALKTVGEIIFLATATVLMMVMLFYYLPDVLAYPYNFDLAGETVASTNFLYRIIGMILGMILDIVAGIAAYQCIKTLSKGKARVFIYLILLIQALNFSGLSIKTMLTKRMLKQTDLLFSVVKFTINYSEYFVFGILLIMLICALYRFFTNIRVTEEYSNPAEHRKIRARMRAVRRFAITFIICAALAVVNLTVIDAYNNKKPELSPVEDCVIDGDNVYVDLTGVQDGHLHRYGYTTDNGIQVRFIVIQKPNSSAYGVGLDACDICGEAGYYERNDQIVCKRCDVVMNVNTIGFKGGCNPKVIDYTIEDGQVIVPISELVAHEYDFD